MSSSQSLLLPSTLTPPPLPRLIDPHPPSSPLTTARRLRHLPRLVAKSSPAALATSPPGGFGDGINTGGGGVGGGGWWWQGGRDPPDPGDGWRRWLQSLHPEYLLFLLLQFDAFASIPSAFAEALGASGGGKGASVWEVRGGARTLLVPDPTGSSYVVAGDERPKQEEGVEKVGGGRDDLAALRRQLDRSWRRFADVAVQLLLPDGYPH